MEPVVCHLVEARSDRAAEAAEYLGRRAGIGPADHRVIPVTTGTLRAAPIEADVIVSHLPIEWRRFPFLVALRAVNPNREIVHMASKDYSESMWNTGGFLPNAASLRNCAYALFDRIQPDRI
ncbi:hypothetical protein [Falsiphaeobacter marinintestinus]|uniref:hypothetical protein n=1 Tax=Falsiphaeobacter marinintestinus TaxID=1492905 RepID=UPI0011B8440D|nr:hypothetical protein [Phaeobacter marinintestinus]